MTVTAADAFDVANTVAGIKNSFFRDLWFRSTKSNYPFSKIVGKRCSYLRISVPDGHVMHLSSMRLWAEDSNGNLQTINTLNDASLGSHYHSHTFKPECLLEFEDLGMHLHTDKSSAHVVLTFDECLLHRIEINNIEGAYISRGWRISIETSVDGTNWTPVYSHTKRESEFPLFCRESLSNRYPPHLVNRTIDLIREGFRNPKKLREKILDFNKNYGPECRSSVNEVLNKQILADQHLEMTSSHGAQNTFRFWTEAKKKSYMAFAREATQMLSALGHEVFLGYGPVLGLAREGKLIDHDDDIDLILIIDRRPDEPITELLGRFHAILESAGFKVRGDYPNHRHVGLENRPKVLDVFMAVREGDEIYFNPAKVQRVPVDIILPLIEVDFMGQKMTVPKNILGFLTCMYGEDWRTPLPQFHHNWKPLS